MNNFRTNQITGNITTQTRRDYQRQCLINAKMKIEHALAVTYPNEILDDIDDCKILLKQCERSVKDK